MLRNERTHRLADWLADSSNYDGRIPADNKVIASLFIADRVDHLLNSTDGICQKIDSGVSVITDRYYFSSYAYNGVDLDMDWVIHANSISADILRPTLTVFLDIPVNTALERIARRAVSHRAVREGGTSGQGQRKLF